MDAASCAPEATPDIGGCAPATDTDTCAFDGAAAATAPAPTGLVPGVMLPCRADAVEVVGEALSASAAGKGYLAMAARLGRPAATVRGRVRRFTASAQMTLKRTMRCLIRIEPDPATRLDQAALLVLGAATPWSSELVRYPCPRRRPHPRNARSLRNLSISRGPA